MMFRTFSGNVFPASGDVSPGYVNTATTRIVPFLSPRGFAFGSSWTVAASTTKTFADGVAGTAVLADLTYTDKIRQTTSPVTIAYTSGGTAGSEVVTVTGNAISIKIASGTSTATQVRTAYNLVTAATNLATCAVTGTGSNTQVTTSAVGITGGTDSGVSTTNNTTVVTAHGWNTGRKVRLTTTGTLPAGLALSTDYYLIVVDANTLAYASSLANALLGTKISITDQGTSGSTATITPQALAGGTLQHQASADGGVNFNNIGTTVSISASGTDTQNFDAINYTHLQTVITVTSGELDAVTVYGNGYGFER